MTRKAYEAPDRRRIVVFETRACLCSPCWQARCQCGAFLTKHAFTAVNAHDEALQVLASSDPRSGFGHPECRGSA